MRLEHLSYILEIGKYHSVNMAAQKLFISPAALRTILRQTEEELGFPIFQRTKNGLYATQEGESALTHIKRICTSYDEVSALGKFAQVSSRPVRIVTSPSINAFISIPVNRSLLVLEPFGNLEFRVVPGEDVGSRIIKNVANIGITYMRKPMWENYASVWSRYQITVESLCEDSFYLLVSEDHPLADRKTVFPEDIRGLDLATLAHFTSSDSKILAEEVAKCRHYTVFPTIALIKQAVLDQNMAAILSGLPIREHHVKGDERLKAIPLQYREGINRFDLCLICRGESSLRYLEKVVLQCIRKYIASLPSV